MSTLTRSWILCGLLAAAAAGLSAQSDQCPVEKQVNLTVQSSAQPSLPGQTVMLSIFVEPVVSIAEPIGTVNVVDDLVDLGTFPLKLAQTSTNTIFNTAGTHVLRVFYSGDFNYCAAGVFFGQGVSRLGTSLTLTSSATTATVGAPVTFTAQVVPATPKTVPDPAGQVQFLDGGTAIGAVAPVTGKATVTVANLSAGTHQITAVYSGDSNWYQLRSTPLVVTVGRTAVSTVLAATATPTQATLMATVGAATGGVVPSGTVQFVDAASNTTVVSAPLPAGSAVVSVTLNAPQFAAAGGHALAAVYSGDANFAGSTSNTVIVPVLINSAGAASPAFAAEEEVSLFGANLAGATLLGDKLPLPTSLGGISVSVKDSAGVERPAGLILVSPGQLNFVMPVGVATGTATVTVTSATASVAPLSIPVATIAPGIYSAGSNGKGLAAAQIIRVHPDGTQNSENVSPAPISFGPDTLYLVLYGTGIRGRSSPANVTCAIGPLTLPVAYAGAQSQYPGLDQVDVQLPASLKGSGTVNVSVTVDGQTSNVVTVTFQ